jgi:hypothetical protein
MQQDSATQLTTFAATLAAVAAGIAAAAVWWQTPELHVDAGVRPAVAHMELMGEYPSNIRSIAIEREASGDPVWKIVTNGDFFQIHSVSLVAGDNPIDATLFRGSARRVAPSSGATFRLDPGTHYRITICPSASLGLCRSASFVLPARRGVPT